MNVSPCCNALTWTEDGAYVCSECFQPCRRWTIHTGDVLDIVPTLGIFDASLSDPPYGLGFMGKDWDKGVPGPHFWEVISERLRPGAHLMAFGGTRTSHRLTCAIEDAGFEIRDSVAWLYGTGFPKSHNVSKAIDKAGGESAVEQAALLTAKREAAGITRDELALLVGCTPSSVRDWEEGRRRATGRPLEYMVPSQDYRVRLAEVLGYTADERKVVGATLDRRGDGSVIGLGHSGKVYGTASTESAVRFDGYGTALKPAHEPITVARKPFKGSVAANCLEHGTGALNIDGARIAVSDDQYVKKCASVVGLGSNRNGATYGEWSGDRENSEHVTGRWPANVVLDETTAAMLNEQGRFFYCAKASRKEREAGLEHRERETVDDGREVVNDTAYQRGATERFNIHPTVKPIALARWLATLMLPPPGPRPRRLLVPFSGSGSEMIGALQAGWDEVVGVELSSEYVEIAKARLAHWTQEPEKANPRG